MATDTLGNMEIIEDGINGVIAQDSPQAFFSRDAEVTERRSVEVED